MPKAHTWGVSHAGDAEQEPYEIHYDEPAESVERDDPQLVDEPAEEKEERPARRPRDGQQAKRGRT